MKLKKKIIKMVKNIEDEKRLRLIYTITKKMFDKEKKTNFQLILFM
ncbi:MAG: hypothetical protein ACRCWG_13585 [Sarcina sp.]